MRTYLCNRIRDLRIEAHHCEREMRYHMAVGDMDQADRYFDEAQEHNDEADALELLLKDIRE